MYHDKISTSILSYSNCVSDVTNENKSCLECKAHNLDMFGKAFEFYTDFKILMSNMTFLMIICFVAL